MGNICCEQQAPRRQNNPIRSVASQRSQQARTPAKSQNELLFQEQKTLLLDFSHAINYLSKNAREWPDTHFKKFWICSLITSDSTAQYFNGTLVNEQQTQAQCVIKKIDKRKFLSKYKKKALAIQYQVTRYLKNSFIVKCLHSYQDQNFLYLYFDLKHFTHLNVYTTADIRPEIYSKFRIDLQNNLRFLIAGVILGIQQLHCLRIVYRGINNQNIVILSDGYPMLTNLSKLHPEEYTNPQPTQVDHFTSLEQYRAQPLTAATDLWDIGVLIYFICKGKYLNFTNFKENQFKAQGLSLDLIDFVNRLLILKPSERLGARNINELKSHSYFSNFDWKAYSQKKIPSPFRDFSSSENNNPIIQDRTQTKFDSNYSEGYGLMGMMLFMDLATIYMLSQAFENQQFQAENRMLESQHDYNQGDEFQMATAIDIGGQTGGVGMDYD